MIDSEAFAEVCAPLAGTPLFESFCWDVAALFESVPANLPSLAWTRAMMRRGELETERAPAELIEAWRRLEVLVHTELLAGALVLEVEAFLEGGGS